MEPNNKLEQEFKDKLEQRTIEPSAMAWDRLDAMLSVSEKKKQPKRRTWMYIAASFLGFLLVGAILLKQEKENTGNTIDTTVVNVEQPAKKIEQNHIEKQDITVGALPINTAPDNTIAAAKQRKAIVEEARCSTIYVTKKLDNSPIVHQEAVAVQEVKQAKDKGAEELLAAASSNNTSKKKSSIKVDASSLLSSVEGELDNSFRSEVLQRVVKNYNTVKTSVANRNYQYK